VPDAVSAESIAEAANSPASASVDGRSAAAVPIDQQIAADRYAKGATALSGTNPNGGKRSGWGKLRTGRAVPPGAV
jgi:hypothetical protein